MPVRFPHPTPYQDVNVFLTLMLSALQTTLHRQLVGLYLGGSLALGDFNPQRSDIDFVVITADVLSTEMIAALAAMHASLWDSEANWARRLDGSYVPQQVIRRWTPEHPPCPFVEGDSFTITNQGSAVIQRHVLGEAGVVVAGPSPRILIESVSADELRSAVHDMLQKWWRPLLDDPTWVEQSQKQPFAILTMCRMLYTFEQGVVVSKPVAARWCQQTRSQEWGDLIGWALASNHAAESARLSETLGFIQYTVNVVSRSYGYD